MPDSTSCQTDSIIEVFDIIYCLWLVFSLVASLLQINFTAKTTLATIGIFLLPLQIGQATLWFMKVDRQTLRTSTTTFISLSWILGSVVMASLFVIKNQIASWLPFEVFVYFISFLCMTISFFNLTHRKNFNLCISNKYKIDFMLIIPIIYSLYLFLKLRSHSPFPYWMGVDQFNFIGNSFLLRSGELTILDSTAYFPIIESLVASVSILENMREIYAIFWPAPFMLYVLFAIGVYELSNKITKSKITSVVASVVGLSAFGGGSILDLWYFIPRNIIYSFTPTIISFFLYEMERHDTDINPQSNKQVQTTIFWLVYVIFLFWLSTPFLQPTEFQWIRLVLPLVPFIFITWSRLAHCSANWQVSLFFTFAIMQVHTFIGTLVLITIIVVWLIRNLNSQKSKVYTNVIFFIFIMFVLSTIIGIVDLPEFLSPYMKKILSSFLKPESLSSIWSYYFSLKQKLDMLEGFFTKPIFWLGTLGLLITILDQEHSILPQKEVAIMLSFALILYFLPIEYTYRTLCIISPLIALSSSMFIEKFEKALIPHTRIKLCINSVFRFTNVYIEIPIHEVLTLIILLLLLPSLQTPIDNYVNYYLKLTHTHGSIATFDSFDIMASEWIRGNVENNAIIVSDLQSQRVVCGLSGKMFTILARTEKFGTKWAIINYRSYFQKVFSSQNVSEVIESANTLIDLYTSSLSSNKEFVEKCPLYVVFRGSTKFPEGSIYSLFPSPIDESTIPKPLKLPMFKLVYSNSHYRIYRYFQNFSLITDIPINVTIGYSNGTRRNVQLYARYHITDDPNYRVIILKIPQMDVGTDILLPYSNEWSLLYYYPKDSANLTIKNELIKIKVLNYEEIEIIFLENQDLNESTPIREFSKAKVLYTENVANYSTIIESWRIRLVASLYSNKSYYWISIPFNDTSDLVSRSFTVLYNSSQAIAFVALRFNDGSYIHVVPFSSFSIKPTFSTVELPDNKRVTEIILGIDNRNSKVHGVCIVDFYSFYLTDRS